MSVCYYLLCVDCGEAINLGKYVSATMGGATSEFYVPTALSGITSNREPQENDRVSAAVLGHFLLQHRGHELRFVTEDFLNGIDEFSGDITPMSIDELSTYLEVQSPTAPNLEEDTYSIDSAVAKRTRSAIRKG